MHYLLIHLNDVWVLTMVRLCLSLLPVLLQLVIAMPLGVLVQCVPSLRLLTMAAASVVFTVSSLALFVALLMIIGTRSFDEANVMVVLTACTTALLVCVVLEVLDAVPVQVSDVATVIGYSPIYPDAESRAVDIFFDVNRRGVRRRGDQYRDGSVIGLGGLST